VGWMTGFEPATTGATVPSDGNEEGAPSHVVRSDANLHNPEEGRSDINDA